MFDNPPCLSAAERRRHRSHRRYGIGALGLLLALLGAGVLGRLLATPPRAAVGASAPPLRPGAPASCAWTVVPAPDPDPVNGRGLYSLTALSPSDIWAAGDGGGLTLVLHWDGTAWTVVPSPNPGLDASYLRGITALGPADIWAVGQRIDNGITHTLTEHWDGTTWTVVPSPDGTYSGRFGAVAAVAPDDVWAAGSNQEGGHYAALIDHWDGTAWQVAFNSGAFSYSEFRGITARSPTDVWAVGDGQTMGGVQQPLLVHWDGQTWTEVDGPAIPQAQLWASAFSGVTDGWAVGGAAIGQALTEHWDGTAWARVPAPRPGTSGTILYGVAALAPADAWAVGYWSGPGNNTLIYHWDGSAWTQVPSPSPGQYFSDLEQLLALAPDNLWAVGYTLDCPGCAEHPLIEHYSGDCPPPTATATTPPAPPSPTPTATVPPSATPSATAALPTPTAPASVTTTPPASASPPSPETATATRPPSRSATPTAPAATSVVSPSPPPASATPTPCGVAFSDVHATNYFYGPVQYLACRGVISGYGDGTFRPYNDTTRAQMVKIVVLGFGLPSTTPAGGASTFSDVPPDAPFFAVIETAAAHHIISGYTCGPGGPGPCDPQQRPYFLPNTPVTRG